MEADRFDLAGDFLLATELADFLVDEGVPFREAHHVVGGIVRWCESQGGNFSLLTPEVLADHHPALGEGALQALDPTRAFERRTSRGGTAWVEIERQVSLLRSAIGNADQNG